MKRAALNQYALLFLTSIIAFTPFFALRRILIIGAAFGIWYLTAAFIDKKFVVKSIPFLAFITFWGVLSYFIKNDALANSSEFYFSRYIAFSLWTYIWCIVYVFYADHISLIKKPLYVIVAFFLFSCLLTIRGNIIHPDASRLLAGLSEEDAALGYELRSMCVGGYDFIYGLVFLVMPVALCCKYRVKPRFYWRMFLLLVIVTILFGDFFTGFILALVMFIMANVKASNRSSAFFMSLFLLVLFIFFKDYFLQLIIRLSDYFGFDSISHRANQVLLGTYQSDYDLKVNDISRSERALNAVKNFFDSPLLGQLVSRSTPIRESGHSEFLTYFEKFGLLALSYVWFYWLFFKKCAGHLKSLVFKRYYFFYAVMIVAFLFLDTFDVANATGLVVFFLAPVLFQILDEHHIA